MATTLYESIQKYTLFDESAYFFYVSCYISGREKVGTICRFSGMFGNPLYQFGKTLRAFGVFWAIKTAKMAF